MSEEPEEVEKQEQIEANTSFFAAAKISKSLAEKNRQSPDINKMVGARISWRMANGDLKTCEYYYKDKATMKEKLPHVLPKYINPIVEYIK